MNVYKNDKELFALMKKELFTAVVGDCLDKLGYLHQFLPPYIKSLNPTLSIVGRAMPVLEADVFNESLEGNNPLLSKPFGLMFEALDDLKENEVYIATGSSHRYALWGGLMSIRAQKLKANGAILDGYVRDTKDILELDFPIFSLGSYAQDQGPRGKVLDWRIPIEISGVRINPRDIIFGDRDGVLIIPQEIEKEVIEAALEKVRGENKVAKALKEGMSTVEAFQKFGIM